MSLDEDRVIAGYMRLSDLEQRTVIRELRRYIDESSVIRRRGLKESAERRAGLELGPIDPGGCPCCGR